MTDEELRLECLKLAQAKGIPGAMSHDRILDIAEQYVGFVLDLPPLQKVEQGLSDEEATSGLPHLSGESVSVWIDEASDLTEEHCKTALKSAAGTGIAWLKAHYDPETDTVSYECSESIDGEEDISQPALETTITQMQESGDLRTGITPQVTDVPGRGATYFDGKWHYDDEETELAARYEPRRQAQEEFSTANVQWTVGKETLVCGPDGYDILKSLLTPVDGTPQEPEGPEAPPINALAKTVWS